MRMLHTDLNRISSVDDAVRYWCERHAAEEAAVTAEANHWKKVHPPNVCIDESRRMHSLIKHYGADPQDPEIQAMDTLSAWCRRNGMEAMEGWTQEQIDEAEAADLEAAESFEDDDALEAAEAADAEPSAEGGQPKPTHAAR